MKKIIPNILELKKIGKNLRKQRKKIVLCHGVFDLIHLGHIKHFKEAKQYGDILFVSITADKFVNKGPNKPLFNQLQRQEYLSSLSIIDYLIINFSETSEQIINNLRPNFYCKGPDYKKNKNDISKNIYKEKKFVEKNGGKIIYTKDETFSSSEIINKSFNFLNQSQKNTLSKIKKNFEIKKIIQEFEKLKRLNVLVIGETIIDEYNFCDAIGKAGKDPVLVFKDLENKRFIGGALSIAKNISSFCNEVKVISMVGDKDEYRQYISKNLEKNISAQFIKKKDSPTILKKRYVDIISKNKLLGVYKLNDETLNKNEENQVLNLLNKFKNKFDLIIVADYGHGFLTKKIIVNVLKKGKFISANSQLNSFNKGYHDLNKYINSDCMVINDSEIRYELRDRQNKIEVLMRKLKKKMKIKHLIVTRGSEGAIILDKNNKFFYSDAFASKVVDKVGAGDNLFAVSSLLLCNKVDNSLSLLSGSIAAALNVENFGNSPISKNKIIKSIEYLLK